jgi:hypothetical protein
VRLAAALNELVQRMRDDRAIGRGVQMELRQAGAMVTGCSDGAGELAGTGTGR